MTHYFAWKELPRSIVVSGKSILVGFHRVDHPISCDPSISVNQTLSNYDLLHPFFTEMSSGFVQSSDGSCVATNWRQLLPCLQDQLIDSTSPPETLTGEPHWGLQRWIESPTSPSNNIGGIITEDDEHCIETLKAQENDGLYFIKGGQEGDVLVRLYCQTLLECEVKAKMI
jgi:hypothetical protein